MTEYQGMSYRRVNLLLTVCFVLSLVLIIGGAWELNGLLQFTDWSAPVQAAPADSVVLP